MRQVLLPANLDDLWKILEEEPGATVYAGGTDFLVKLRHSAPLVLLPPPSSALKLSRSHAPLVCLERIGELKGIYEDNGRVFIGACSTHTQLIASRLIQKEFPILVQALKVLGSPPIRNMGTIGGNICTASPAGDTLPALYVLEAEVEIRSRKEKRILPVREFVTGPGKTALTERELLYGAWINTTRAYNVHHFEKVGQRKALAISIASLAALMNITDSGIVDTARLAWGSVGPTVVTSPEVEKSLIGKPLSTATLRMASSIAQRAVSPIDDVRASADYRRTVSGNLLFRFLEYRV